MNADPQALFSAFIVIATMLLVGFPIHEGLHAWTAWRLGDNTARWQGRVSMDPRVHFDPMGGAVLAITVIFSTLGSGGLLFGWAKPTPVNPLNLRYGRRGDALVAFAGPASNLVIAVLVAIPMRIIFSSPELQRTFFDGGLLELALNVGWTLISLNIVLFIFNLVPIPPLDGWHVLTGLAPASVSYQLKALEARYANMIPMVFLGFIVILFVTGGAFLGSLISGIRDLLLGI